MSRIVPFGEAAVLVVLGDRVDEATNRRVHRLAARVRELASPDLPLEAPVPGSASLLVPFDPIALDPPAVADLLRPLVDRPEDADVEPGGARLEVPTRYGGDDGPDLEDVAALHSLRPADVVELHASVEYRVSLLGFVPGFAYLGGVPAAIATPRLDTPRPRVPAGSVGIAGDQTAIYPFDSPGGWRLIGRTGLRMWNARHEPPARLAPGDRVRFVPSDS